MTVTREFVIENMHCTHCAMTIDWAIEDLAGVVEASTSFARGRTKVVVDPEKVNDMQIVAALRDVGYTARPVGGPQQG